MRDGMRLSVLGSGSGGNCCYIETENAGLVVDAGLSCREMERRLERIGVRVERLDALIITHEHTDHIRGAGALARRFKLPVYMNRKTYGRGTFLKAGYRRPVLSRRIY